MKASRSGFGVLYGFLILVIVGLIGFAGWHVWHSKNAADKSYPAASNTQNSSSSTDCNGSDLGHVCIEQAPAQITTFSKLPPELQKVAITEVEKQTPPCVQNGHLVDYNGDAIDPEVKYAPIGSAIIVIGCDSGSAGLFAKDAKEGQWKFIEKTQLAFSCDSVFSNPVPKKLLELSSKAECIDSSGQVQTYDTESSKRFY